MATKNNKSEDTTLPTLVGPRSSLPSLGKRRPRRIRNLVSWALTLLAVAAMIAATVIRLPYYRIAPGTTYDTIDRVQVYGEQVFIPEGKVDFVTVSQTANINPLQYALARLDKTVELKTEEEVLGTGTAEEKREQDRRRMQLSKNSAVVVALQRLGYELIITHLGVEVASVFPCTAADGNLGTGDLIVGVEGVAVSKGSELVAELAGYKPGDTVEFEVGRIDPIDHSATSAVETVSLTLGSADDECLPDDVRAEEPRAFMGIGTHDYVQEDLPFEVAIETGRVGGPSAGLAFTLAIMDVLTDGEMTNGLHVVATGTITRDHRVGPVGGVRHKVIAAARSGADLFLVPECCEQWQDIDTGEPLEAPSNIEEALEFGSEEDIVIAGVSNLDDALRALGEAGGDVSLFFDDEGNPVYPFAKPQLETEGAGQRPSEDPSEADAAQPQPTAEPTSEPTTAPTDVPVEEPSVEPTQAPTSVPTTTPTVEPSAEPEVESSGDGGSRGGRQAPSGDG